jgi:hypothetical protein
MITFLNSSEETLKFVFSFKKKKKKNQKLETSLQQTSSLQDSSAGLQK